MTKRVNVTMPITSRAADVLIFATVYGWQSIVRVTEAQRYDKTVRITILEI